MKKASDVLSRLSEIGPSDPGMVAADRAGKSMLADRPPEHPDSEYDDWGKGDLMERAAQLRKAAKDATKMYRELVSLSNFYHKKGIAVVDKTLEMMHSEIEAMASEAERLSQAAKGKKL